MLELNKTETVKMSMQAKKCKAILIINEKNYNFSMKSKNCWQNVENSLVSYKCTGKMEEKH